VLAPRGTSSLAMNTLGRTTRGIRYCNRVGLCSASSSCEVLWAHHCRGGIYHCRCLVDVLSLVPRRGLRIAVVAQAVGASCMEGLRPSSLAPHGLCMLLA